MLRSETLRASGMEKELSRKPMLDIFSCASELEAAMLTSSSLPATDLQRHHHRAVLVGRLAALLGFFLLAMPAFAVGVPVRDGESVHLKLLNILTTDNARKGDVIAFEVTDDVIVNGHVVIAKGATAHAKVTDIKEAFKPRAKNAEVDFQFLTVRAVDRQELPLRPQPEKTKKGRETEVREKTLIPGQISRIVGADKGKEYDAYVDGMFTVNAADTIVVPGVAAPAPPTTPTGAATTPTPPTTPAAATLPVDTALPSSVAFESTPEGADIVVDGNEVGSTPSTLRLTPGHHAIELHLAGYRTWARIMVVDPESHPSVRAVLIKQ